MITTSYYYYYYQNSPYFCVLNYARTVKQKIWSEAENRERDCGETLYHAKPILRKKPTVLQSTPDRVIFNQFAFSK